MEGSALEAEAQHPPIDVPETPVYCYRPLPSDNHIRRLILQPGAEADPLIGRLQTVELTHTDELGSFEAISYVWGPNNKNKALTIDGGRLAITTSLEQALCRLRCGDRPRALWADSVCINQGDEAEKGQQVALMGRIYQTSRRTLICLGVEPEYRQHARDVAGLVDDIGQMMDRVFNNPNFSWAWNTFPIPEADDPLITDPRWESWPKLVNRPWFRRGWVVQEAALGPDALVFWAGVEMKWISLLRCHEWLVARAKHLLPTMGNDYFILRAHSQMFRYSRRNEAQTLWRDSEQERLKPMAALELLGFARQFQVTNPKDRIYAMMALPTSNDGIPDLQPDYSERSSDLDVYRDFATKYLKRMADLDLLSFVEHEEDELVSSAFPSWVPRWDRGDDVVTFFDAVLPKLNSNDGGPSLSLDDGPGDPILRVRGVIIDSVEYVARETQDVVGPAAVEEVVRLWREVVPHSTKQRSPHYSRLGIAFLTAVRRDRYDGDRVEFMKSQRAFAQLLHSDQPHHPLGKYTHNRDAQRISTLAVNYLYFRRLILLGRGCYGLAPRITHEADVCAIIHGSRTPFILRKVTGQKGHYRLVGPAYVQSKAYVQDKESEEDGMPYRLGDGEWSNDWKEWDLPTEDLYLR